MLCRKPTVWVLEYCVGTGESKGETHRRGVFLQLTDPAQERLALPGWCSLQQQVSSGGWEECQSVTTPFQGRPQLLPEGQPSLKQVAAPLPTSSCSLEAAICLSPSGVALMQRPCCQPASFPTVSAETTRPHRLPPQKEAVSVLRMRETPFSFRFRLC